MERTPKALTLALAVTLALAGCSAAADGSSDASGEDAPASSEEAKAIASERIAAATAIPEFTLDAEPLDLSKIEGKKIFNIPLTSSIPYVVAISDQGRQLAEENGLTWVEFTNQGTPTEYAAGINQAIQQKADVIILSQGIDPQLIIPALQDAKNAGIPVVAAHLYQNGEQAPDTVKDLIAALSNAPFEEMGRLQVDYAVSQDGCDITPMVVNGTDIPPGASVQSGIESELAELCPGVELEQVKVTVPEWGTKIRPEVQSRLTQNPDIDWVFTHWDSMTIPVEAGIRAAGKIGDVKATGANGTPEILRMIQEGETVAADIGENTNWLAYATIDQTFRVLGAGPVIESGTVGTPIRVFDRSNVDETGVPPTFDDGYGTAYVEGYRKLWGLQ